MTLTTQKAKIKEINSQIELMANLVEKQLYKCMVGLKNHDEKIGEEIIKDDDKVDELQKKIEE